MIKGDVASVERAQIHHAVADGDASSCGDVEHLGYDGIEFGFVVPKGLAGLAVDGEDIVIGADVVDDAIDHDGRCLQAHLNVARLMNPGHLQLFDIAGVDLIERAVAPRVVGAIVFRPIVWRVFSETWLWNHRGRQSRERRGGHYWKRYA